MALKTVYWSNIKILDYGQTMKKLNTNQQLTGLHSAVCFKLYIVSNIKNFQRKMYLSINKSNSFKFILLKVIC